MADDDLTWAAWQDELPFGGDDDSFESQIPNGPYTLTDRTQGGTQIAAYDAMGTYQIPTSTTNPERPRTVAAKYEPNEKAVYVVMRPYHQRSGNLKTPIVKYSPVTALGWSNFKRAYSKGRYILNTWEGGGEVSWEEVSSIGGFDAFLLSASAYAISQQKAREGLQDTQSEGSADYQKLRKAVAEGRRVSDVKLRSDKLGGTGRKRKQIAELDDAVKSFYRNR